VRVGQGGKRETPSTPIFFWSTTGVQRSTVEYSGVRVEYKRSTAEFSGVQVECEWSTIDVIQIHLLEAGEGHYMFSRSIL
jgi:hypothetical protein